MREEILFEIKSLYRESMRIRAYTFGDGEKTACIAGATRGNEVQQVYMCSRLVKRLAREEKAGNIAKGKSITVIPCLNSYSMNIGKRFWPTDNTDINRMFPGYAQGETTQRIAAAVFDKINDYEYGMQFASFYIPGLFLPHVKIIKTDYSDLQDAKFFELPYIVLRKPDPYDTTTLNYNWQIWNVKAFSLYANITERIDEKSGKIMEDAVMRFLNAVGAVNCKTDAGVQSRVLYDKDFTVVNSHAGGLFVPEKQTFGKVKKGQTLARIISPFSGDVTERVVSPVDGTVFYSFYQSLAHEGSPLFEIIPD
ncbi:MAG: M14 family metallopeptidase [Clostridia bacterium]|nr:M14 family metallopeptidase [Clostridia bacterium]